LLEAIEQAGDPDPARSKSVEEFLAREDQLARLIKTSRKLAYAKSDRNGSFRVEIQATSPSVIVFGYAQSEDGPAGYAWSRVRVKEAVTSGVILDFTHGHCGH
jgi:hypothetical protein